MTDSASRLSRRWITAVLFLAMALNVPLLYYLFVVGGIVSYAGLIMIGVDIHVLPPVFVISIIHLLVYGAILLGLSMFLARRIHRCPPRSRKVWTAVAVTLLFCLGLLPVFGFFGIDRAPTSALESLTILPRQLD